MKKKQKLMSILLCFALILGLFTWMERPTVVYADTQQEDTPTTTDTSFPSLGKPGDDVKTYSGESTRIISWVEAEDFSKEDSRNVMTSTIGSSGSGCLAGAVNGSYACYKNVDFGTGTKGLVYAFAIGPEGVCCNHTRLEIRLDSPDGQDLLVENKVRHANQRSWTSWNVVYTNTKDISGVHDVYLKFSTEEKLECARIDYFYLTEGKQFDPKEQKSDSSASTTKGNTYYIHAYCEGSGVAKSKKLVIKANVKKKKITIRGIGYKTKSKKFTSAKKYKKKYKGKTFKVAKNFRYTDEDVSAMGKDYFTFKQAFKLSKTVYGPLARIKIVKNKIVRIDCSC